MATTTKTPLRGQPYLERTRDHYVGLTKALAAALTSSADISVVDAQRAAEAWQDSRTRAEHDLERLTAERIDAIAGGYEALCEQAVRAMERDAAWPRLMGLRYHAPRCVARPCCRACRSA